MTSTLFTLLLAVNAPTLLTSQALSPNSIQLNWVQSGKVTGFRIERLTFGQNTFQFIKQLDQNSREYLDTPLTPSTGYLYRIQSVKGNQRSAFTSAPGYTYTPPDIPPADADYLISVSPPSQTIQAGASTSYTVTVTALNGFDSNVVFGLTGAPANASYTFAPPNLTASGVSQLTITTTSLTPASTFGLTIGSSSGMLSHSWGVQLIVTLPACGQVIQGQRTLVATAADSQSPIASVQILLDDSPFGPPMLTPPYTQAWNTTQTSNGCHFLYATARDTAGNIGNSAAFTVEIRN